MDINFQDFGANMPLMGHVVGIGGGAAAMASTSLMVLSLHAIVIVSLVLVKNG